MTLSGATPQSILTGSVFNDEGATWADLHDGTGILASANSGTVDTNTLGTYILYYSYTDSSGNTGSTTRTVNVVG